MKAKFKKLALIDFYVKVFDVKLIDLKVLEVHSCPTLNTPSNAGGITN